MDTAGKDYAFAGLAAVLAVTSFVFLDGPTAVFLGIAAAIVAAIFLVKGLQAPSAQEPDPLQLENDAHDAGFDWDEIYQRELGNDER